MSVETTVRLPSPTLRDRTNRFLQFADTSLPSRLVAELHSDKYANLFNFLVVEKGTLPLFEISATGNTKAVTVEEAAHYSIALKTFRAMRMFVGGDIVLGADDFHRYMHVDDRAAWEKSLIVDRILTSDFHPYYCRLAELVQNPRISPKIRMARWRGIMDILGPSERYFIS